MFADYTWLGAKPRELDGASFCDRDRGMTGWALSRGRVPNASRQRGARGAGRHGRSGRRGRWRHTTGRTHGALPAFALSKGQERRRCCINRTSESPKSMSHDRPRRENNWLPETVRKSAALARPRGSTRQRTWTDMRTSSNPPAPFEAWMGKRTDVSRRLLKEKHRKMSGGVPVSAGDLLPLG